MGFTGGLVLLGIAAAMLWFGRAKNGELRFRFMQVWILFIGYTMACLTLFTLGIAFIVIHWPI